MSARYKITGNYVVDTWGGGAIVAELPREEPQAHRWAVKATRQGRTRHTLRNVPPQVLVDLATVAVLVAMVALYALALKLPS